MRPTCSAYKNKNKNTGCLPVRVVVVFNYPHTHAHTHAKRTLMPHTRPHVVCAIAITICLPASLSLSLSHSPFLCLSYSLSHGCGLANILRSQCDIVVEMPIGWSKVNTHTHTHTHCKEGNQIAQEEEKQFTEDSHVYLCPQLCSCVCVCVLRWAPKRIKTSSFVLGFGIATC